MRYLFLCLFAFLVLACGNDVPPPPAMPPLSDLPLIPLPVEISDSEGYLYVNPADTHANEGADAGAMAYLKGKEVPALPLTTNMDPGLQLKDGAYLLQIAPEGVSINAKDQAGLLNGAITLEQVVAFSPNTERGIFLPSGVITDEPRYAYRGYMLDVARTFFGVDTVKQVIDRISTYKINHLAYAELNLDGKARDPYTGTEVGFSTLDANKEVTYEFIDAVVGEISAITPGPYFHIGGDESAVTPHDDYVKLIRRAQEIVISHGKRSIGWDEVAVAGLAEGSIAQLWNHTEYALMAKKLGGQVLFSPACYYVTCFFYFTYRFRHNRFGYRLLPAHP